MLLLPYYLLVVGIHVFREGEWFVILDLAADDRNRVQFGQEPGSIRQDHGLAADEEYIEIPEDAYKQNSVYRPWQPRGIAVGDSDPGSKSAEDAARKREAS